MSKQRVSATAVNNRIAFINTQLKYVYQSLINAIIAHRQIILILIVFITVSYLSSKIVFGWDKSLTIYNNMRAPAILLPFFIYLLHFIYKIAYARYKLLLPGFSVFSYAYQNRLYNLEQLFGILILLVLLKFFAFSFISLKQLFSIVKPFTWDEAFMSLDYITHFSNHPWQLIQNSISTGMTRFIDLLYVLWLPISLIFTYCVILSKNNLLRQQYLLSYLLCWIGLGSIFAFCFLSAGPCYYDKFVTDGTNPYQSLMAYLNQNDFSLHASKIQNKLWQSYQVEQDTLFVGISAMPSLHVSMAVLYALTASQINRTLGVIFTLYAIIIFIGSVHLAWHYAIDSYLAIIATIAIWYFVKYWIKRDKIV